MSTSHAASTDAITNKPYPAALLREDSSSSAEQASMSSSAAMSASTASASAQATSSALSAPVQKRRRITRACDECRRKKIKCDGRQPCLHCTVYSYECTYNQPSNRSRKPNPQYVEALERRLQEAEAMLKSVMPNVRLGGQGPATGQQKPSATNVHDQQSSNAFPAQPATAIATKLATESTSVAAQDCELEPQMSAMTLLEFDKYGSWHCCGHSSGLDLVKQIHDTFASAFCGSGSYKSHNLSSATPSEPLTKSLQRIFATLFGPSSLTERPSSDMKLRRFLPLPPRRVIYRLCEVALQDACALSPIVHRPTFKKSLDRILTHPEAIDQHEDQQFMPLLYAVLAVGCIHAKDERLLPEEEGYKYFRASQSLLNITSCQDKVSVQTILFIVIYLQLSGNVSDCYFYIGVAARSALRLGLHRPLSNIVLDNETSIRFNPIENETRKRIFWAIFKLDVAISLLLGSPLAFLDEEIDQEQLAEVEDERITENGLQPMDGGKASGPSAANAHTALAKILKKIIRNVYPVKEAVASGASCSMNTYHTVERSEAGQTKLYMTRNQRVKEIEEDLQRWSDALPAGLRPNGDAPPRQLRNQQLLRLLFAQAQMLLYRPFLHELLSAHSFSAANSRNNFDEELKGYAAMCVGVSRNIIQITSEARSQYLLQKDYWFAIYSTFFAVFLATCSLLRSSTKGAEQDLQDILKGKDAIVHLAGQNSVADRCSVLLESLFEKLSGWLMRSRSNPLEHTADSKSPPSQNVPNMRSISQISVDAPLLSLSGSHPELPSGVGSSNEFNMFQETRQQVSDQQQYTPKHMLQQKQQQYHNFMANLYPGHPASPVPALSGSTSHQAVGQEHTTQTQQVSASQSTSHVPDVCNSDSTDGLLASMPIAALSPNPNSNVALADISDLLFTPADPFAYPFSPITAASAAGVASSSAAPATDVEMADYFISNPFAAMDDETHANKEGTASDGSCLPPGMGFGWGQSEIFDPLPPSASETVLASANPADTGHADGIVIQQSQQQQQQREYKRLDDHEQGDGHIPSQEHTIHGSLRIFQSKPAPKSEPGSEEDSESGDDDSRNVEGDVDEDETESDDDDDDDDDDDGNNDGNDGNDDDDDNDNDSDDRPG